ncbi:MAG: uroporphyrinogen-III C-methyltransferase [Pirellulaceae bacterium]
MTKQVPQATGMVYLVGAGPGAPGLITLRGVECLAKAEVVLYDYLVNPRILQHVPPACERICLGRHGQTRIWSQAEINAELVERARANKIVVRLKGGDSSVFAHLGEEVEALVRHGIDFEIVPGITAALAAGSYAGVPLTHRDLASAVAFVVGQEGEGKEGPPLDYRQLAQFPGTLVVYMGVTSAPRWSAALLEAGMSPETPAVIVRRCTFPDQRTVRCTLGELTEHLVPATRLRPPVIVILGPVAAWPVDGGWFERRPLFGQTVLVTRAAHQSQALADRLEELGANVLLQPAIRVRAPHDWAPVDAALERLSSYDWLVFSSANGVRALLERLAVTGRDLRALGGLRLAAIGPATADTLAQYHLRTDLQPLRYQAEDLAAALARQAAGQRFLLARASRGREVLAEDLQAAGGLVEQVVVYESVDVETPEPDVAQKLREGRIDWTTVTSSAIARALWAMFGHDLRQTQLVSISAVTTATLRELGLEPAAEAVEATMPGVVDILCRHR